MSKNALITCIVGQDGSCLAELLLDKDYTIYSLVRRLSIPNTFRIDHILNREPADPYMRCYRTWGVRILEVVRHMALDAESVKMMVETGLRN